MRVKKIRLAAGFSMPQLSKLSGLHRRTIQEVEKRNDCLVSTAKILSQALNVTLGELCSEEEGYDTNEGR